ncbi:MAG TPA: RNA 2',3'-cyclic phosphodiesterase [Methanomassiliicoccales archaeon]|nr:RNA 2',3'-cyclic phosphodiesterase [Methanomassiliicoccales archaeon]
MLLPTILPFRGFIAVEVRPTDRLRDFHARLSTVRGIKVVDVEQVHITLKFLGPTDESLVPKIVEAMRSAIDGVKPFEMKLAGSGVFPSRSNARVVWAGLEGADPLGVMAARLEDLLADVGFQKENRPFRPHLTMARVKDPRASLSAAEAAEDFAKVDFGRETVQSILLKKSVLSPSGPTYSTVAEVRLEDQSGSPS